jgi:hypothetical protein
LKNRLDNKNNGFGSIAARYIALLSEEEQTIIETVLRTEKCKLSVDNAKKIRKLSEKNECTVEKVESILKEETNGVGETKPYTIKSEIISKYFHDLQPNEIDTEIIAALQFYRSHNNSDK